MGDTVVEGKGWRSEDAEAPKDGAPASRRAPYSTPALQRHGALWRITEGGNSRQNPETFYTTTGPVT